MGTWSRVLEFWGKETTPADDYYICTGHRLGDPDSPVNRATANVEKLRAKILAKKMAAMTPAEKIRHQISELSYISGDEGDDYELRGSVNRRVDALVRKGLGSRRDIFRMIYRQMEYFALVDFRGATEEFIAAKEAAGSSVSPTGYPWSWLNLAVSNAYWRQLLGYCVSLVELGCW